MQNVKCAVVRVLWSVMAILGSSPIVLDSPVAAEPPAVEKQRDAQTFLFVRTKPTGAEIQLEGKNLGKSNALVPVEPGKHKIVIELEGFQAREQQVEVREGRITRIELTLKPTEVEATQEASSPAGDAESEGRVPQVVATWPAVGALDVDPSISEILVVFDQDMGRGFSWTGDGPELPGRVPGKAPVWRDRRTCVLPVQLEEGRYYRVGINSTSFQNFRSAKGVPARPSSLYFVTEGATEDVKNRVRKPQIVSITPPSGATDVDPSLGEIRVTFDTPMGEGCSWTGGGAHFPTIPQGKKPFWTEDHKTCVLPVELKPGQEYRLGLNSPSHQNFQSEGGVPLEAVKYTFRTRNP